MDFEWPSVWINNREEHVEKAQRNSEEKWMRNINKDDINEWF